MKRDAIVIGWPVDESFEPVSWATANEVDVSKISPSQLVRLDPRSTAAHSCILAQSGSGKSYFLGRLMEELLLATKANLIIVDPNADYLRFYDVVEDASYYPMTYDRQSRLGRLPTEKSTSEFREFMQSANTSFCIVTNHAPKRRPPENIIHNKFRIPYGQLGNSFLYDGRLSYQEAQDLAICHEFAETVLSIKLIAKNPIKFKPGNSFTFDIDWKGAESYIELSTEELRKKLLRRANNVLNNAIVKEGILNACKVCDYVTTDTWKLYDSVLTRYLKDDFLDTVAYYNRPQYRINIIDGTSMDSFEYKTMMNAHVLRRAINSAHEARAEALEAQHATDLRVPTFVVIDEAHTLAPKGECSNAEARCRNVVREIAAGGRKLGIFLILVTSRPEKLDPMVAGEISNLALMRLANRQTLREVITLFGLGIELKRSLDKTLKFPKGRALLLGEWTKREPILLMSAMRRTTESTHDLDPDFWATAPD